MVRIGKGIGYAFGIFAGIVTRDNYQYPYPLKVEDL